MKYSLYKEYLNLFTDNTNDVSIDTSDSILTSRNGYRHYYEIPKSVYESDTKLDISYLETIVDMITNLYDINYKIKVSINNKYIQFYKRGKLVREIKVVKYLNMILKDIIKPKSNFVRKINDENEYIKLRDIILYFLPIYSKLMSLEFRLSSDMLLVVSTHPYDFLSMSTDRRWTSCLNLDKDKNFYDYSYIEELLYYSKCVIYLVDKDDLNINNPYSRFSVIYEEGEYFYESSYGMYNVELCNYVSKFIFKKIKSK